MRTKKEIVKEQVQIQHEMQMAGFNVITCGHCGSILLHRTPKEPFEIDCLCGRTMDLSDCPDYWYEGAELSAEFED